MAYEATRAEGWKAPAACQPLRVSAAARLRRGRCFAPAGAPSAQHAQRSLPTPVLVAGSASPWSLQGCTGEAPAARHHATSGRSV